MTYQVKDKADIAGLGKFMLRAHQNFSNRSRRSIVMLTLL